MTDCTEWRFSTPIFHLWSESRHLSLRCWFGGLQAAETSPVLARICLRRQLPSQGQKVAPRGWRTRNYRGVKEQRWTQASGGCTNYCTERLSSVLSKKAMHVNALNVQKFFFVVQSAGEKTLRRHARGRDDGNSVYIINYVPCSAAIGQCCPAQARPRSLLSMPTIIKSLQRCFKYYLHTLR